MILIILALVGLALGSFVNASVWRLHKQAGGKKHSKKADTSILKGRSACELCGHTLAAADLVPVISWVALRGKCRYCGKPVSWLHPAVELLSATVFVASFLYWPYPLGGVTDYALFILWLLIVTLGLALGVYDARWMVLPNRLMYPFGLVSALFSGVALYANDGSGLASLVLGSVLFGGFFYILYQISRGRWIGGGDVRLGFALGLLLGWQKALLCLALAAYLGTVIILVLVILKKYHAKMKLPFGPLLLTAALFSMLWGSQVIAWYLKLSGVQ